MPAARKMKVKEREVVTILKVLNDIELRPKFKKSYQAFFVRQISSIVEHGRDVLYCLPNVLHSRMGFCAVGFLLFNQRNSQTEVY